MFKQARDVLNFFIENWKRKKKNLKLLYPINQFELEYN